MCEAMVEFLRYRRNTQQRDLLYPVSLSLNIIYRQYIHFISYQFMKIFLYFWFLFKKFNFRRIIKYINEKLLEYYKLYVLQVSSTQVVL